jgi:aspartyl protease family protein
LGHVWVSAKICSLDGSRCEEVRALVDTGATLTVVPRPIAGRVGLKPHRVDVVHTGAGRVRVERAAAVVEVEGRRTVTEVWISDIIDKVLIGVTTLELLGLEVDPSTGRLREAPLLLYTGMRRS